MVAAVINQDDVNRVCNDLSSAGKNVNISTVFDVLGKGGPNTIKKYIAVWRETAEENSTEIAVIDNDLPEEYKIQVLQLGKALFNGAEKEMQATIKRITAEKEEAIAKVEEELREVADVAEQLNSKNIELDEQLEASDQKKKLQDNTISNLEKDMTEQKAISETKLSEALATITNDKAEINSLEIKNRGLEVKNSKQEDEIERLIALLSDKENIISDSESRLKKSDKAFFDSQNKLTEAQTEIKVLIATSKEKEKSKLALEDQLKTLKSLIEKMEVKPKPAPRKKLVTKKKAVIKIPPKV